MSNPKININRLCNIDNNSSSSLTSSDITCSNSNDSTLHNQVCIKSKECKIPSMMDLLRSIRAIQENDFHQIEIPKVIDKETSAFAIAIETERSDNLKHPDLNNHIDIHSKVSSSFSVASNSSPYLPQASRYQIMSTSRENTKRWTQDHPLYQEFQANDPLTLLRNQEIVNSMSNSKISSQDPNSIPKDRMTEYRCASDDSETNSVSGRSTSSSMSSIGSKEAPRRYLCSICDKRFTRPSTLKAHLNSHAGIKPFACPNMNCFLKFTVKCNLTRHLEICGRKASGTFGQENNS